MVDLKWVNGREARGYTREVECSLEDEKARYFGLSSELRFCYDCLTKMNNPQ